MLKSISSSSFSVVSIIMMMSVISTLCSVSIISSVFPVSITSKGSISIIPPVSVPSIGAISLSSVSVKSSIEFPAASVFRVPGVNDGRGTHTSLSNLLEIYKEQSDWQNIEQQLQPTPISRRVSVTKLRLALGQKLCLLRSQLLVTHYKGKMRRLSAKK